MTELVKFSAEETQGISTVLSSASTSVEKATAATNALISRLAAGPMTDQKDAEANNLAVRLRETYDKINGQRTPFTRKMDEIKKMFTAQEAAIKDLLSKVQKFRDDYAREKEEKRKAEEAEIRRKQNADIEKIEFQAAAESRLKSEYAAALASDKQYMLDIFNGLTLDKWDAGVKALKEVSDVFMHDRWEAIQVISAEPKFLNREEVSLLVINVKAGGKFDAASAHYKDQINALRTELTDKLPSKKAELEAIAAAGAKERKKLEDEAAKREAEEKKRLEEEAAAAARKAAEEAEANKQISMAGAMFDGETAIAEVRGSQEGSRPIESYEIMVKSPAGWMEIAALWFRNEGVKTDVAKMEKKTLGSMKTFAERWAKKTGELIDSKNLIYEAKYKAVNRKEAA